jgi:hypothetical protein
VQDVVKSGLFEWETRMDQNQQNAFIEEFKMAVEEMAPIVVVGSEVDDGVLRKGSINILGTEIVLVAMKARLREVMIVRKVESIDPDAPKPKSNPKYPQSKERMIHTDDAWLLVETADERLMEAIQRLILPPSPEELARRKSFRKELIERQEQELAAFSAEDRKLITNLLGRPENRGYGKTHWGSYAVEALVYFGPARLLTMPEKTFTALEDLVLGRGSIFGSFHRPKNRTSNQVEDGLSPQAMYLAMRSRVSGLDKYISELDKAFKGQNYKPGIAAYGIEIIYKVLRAIKDRDLPATPAIDKSQDLVIKLAPVAPAMEPAPVHASLGTIGEALTLDQRTALYEAATQDSVQELPAVS